MDRHNGYIPQVIEWAETSRPTFTAPPVRFLPRQALYYNDHPDEIIEDYDQSQYGAVLREIERHVLEWEAQQRGAGPGGVGGPDAAAGLPPPEPEGREGDHRASVVVPSRVWAFSVQSAPWPVAATALCDDG